MHNMSEGMAEWISGIKPVCLTCKAEIAAETIPSTLLGHLDRATMGLRGRQTELEGEGFTHEA